MPDIRILGKINNDQILVRFEFNQQLSEHRSYTYPVYITGIIEINSDLCIEDHCTGILKDIDAVSVESFIYPNRSIGFKYHDKGALTIGIIDKDVTNEIRFTKSFTFHVTIPSESIDDFECVDKECAAVEYIPFFQDILSAAKAALFKHN